jgi:hypothetical protein
MENSSKPLSTRELRTASFLCFLVASIALGWLDRIIAG